MKATQRHIPAREEVAARADSALQLAYELVAAAETGKLPEAFRIVYDTIPPDVDEPTAPLILLFPFWDKPNSPVMEDEQRWGLATSRWGRRHDGRVQAHIENMQPALTWAEVLYHYLVSLDDARGDPEADRRRKEMVWHINPTAEAYCLECDELFEVSSRNPGQLVCPRCNQRKRQRRSRARRPSERPVTGQ